MRLKVVEKFTDFGKGFIAGVVIAAIGFGIAVGFVLHRVKVKEVVEYAERQQVIEVLRENYSNRDPIEFIEAIPDVRGAVDGASADFLRKRDEALQRLRDRHSD